MVLYGSTFMGYIPALPGLISSVYFYYQKVWIYKKNQKEERANEKSSLGINTRLTNGLHQS